MAQNSFAPVPLEALSNRQKKIVESHLPLVHHTLGGLDDLLQRRPGRHSDLFQEGSLALVEAVRTHDAARHPDFPLYAMARIHYAVSRFAHETSSVIRVPFIAQRRERRRRRSLSEKDRHRPFDAPRVVRLSKRHRPATRPYSNRFPRPDADRDDSPTLGDHIRARYDNAAQLVATRMQEGARTTPAGQQAVRICAQERWTIPEPDEKTPVRQLADSLKCSVSLVMRCEERFIKKIGELLGDDDALQDLLALSRRAPEGMRHRLADHELEMVASGESAPAI